MKNYEQLNVEIILFAAEDIVRTSLTTTVQESGFDAESTWWSGTGGQK